MRALFFFLVLANLTVFAWNAGYFGPDPGRAGEGARLTAQLDADKIRILSAEEARKQGAAGAGAAGSAGGGTPAPAPPAAPGVAPSEATVAAQAGCLEWGSFPAQEVERVQAVLAALKPVPRFTLKRVDETAGWWVFMPPQANKPAADKKLAELKQLGIAEFFVINDEGPNKLAISLGVFKTEEAARNYLAALEKKGVRSARAAERETRVAKTVVVLREVDAPLRARLEEARRDFAGVELRECAADEKRG